MHDLTTKFYQNQPISFEEKCGQTHNTHRRTALIKNNAELGDGTPILQNLCYHSVWLSVCGHRQSNAKLKAELAIAAADQARTDADQARQVAALYQDTPLQLGKNSIKFNNISRHYYCINRPATTDIIFSL